MRRKIRALTRNIATVFWAQLFFNRKANRLASLLADQEVARIKDRISKDMPDSPLLAGYKVFSQCDEDGIIENILSRLPALSYTAIEIGSGNGLENNTHYLVLKGYRSYWIEGSPKSCAFIESALGDLFNRNDTVMINQGYIDRSNAPQFMFDAKAFLQISTPDLLSIDIDGNDLHVLCEVLSQVSPKVLCVEYNARLGPTLDISMVYDENHEWKGDDYHGASLRALVAALPDYKLVCCNISGANAFFVRREYSDRFEDYSIVKIFQPARYALIYSQESHPASLKWLVQSVRSVPSR